MKEKNKRFNPFLLGGENCLEFSSVWEKLSSCVRSTCGSAALPPGWGQPGALTGPGQVAGATDLLRSVVLQFF